MSKTKSAVLRYRVYDELLQNRHKKHTMASMLEAVRIAAGEHGMEGIGQTQFFEDIKFMRSERGGSAPIERYREGRQNYYRYSEPDFKLYQQGLTAAEIAKLSAALDILSKFDGLPQFEFAAELTTLLESRLILPTNARKIVYFDDNKDYMAASWLSDIFNFIHSRQALAVVYAPFGDGEREWIISPACLRQYNGRWYMFGRNHAEPQNVYKLPLDRLKKITPVDAEYQEMQVDWEDYFFEMVGISKFPESCADVVRLRFSAEQAPYIETKPLHPTQRLKKLDDGQAEVRLMLVINRELENLICSHGEHVEVLAPECLRKRIADRLKAAADHY